MGLENRKTASAKNRQDRNKWPILENESLLPRIIMGIRQTRQHKSYNIFGKGRE